MILLSLYISFLAIFALISFIALKSQYKLKYLVPLLLVVFVFLCHYSINTLVGRPRPYNISYLSNLGIPKNSIVVGGDLSSNSIDLLVKDETSDFILLYRFPNDPRFRNAIKKAMQNHADNNGGEQWGFKLNPPKNNSGGSNYKTSAEFDSAFPNPGIAPPPLQPLPKDPIPDSSGDISHYHIN